MGEMLGLASEWWAGWTLAGISLSGDGWGWGTLHRRDRLW